MIISWRLNLVLSMPAAEIVLKRQVYIVDKLSNDLSIFAFPSVYCDTLKIHQSESVLQKLLKLHKLITIFRVLGVQMVQGL